MKTLNRWFTEFLPIDMKKDAIKCLKTGIGVGKQATTFREAIECICWAKSKKYKWVDIFKVAIDHPEGIKIEYSIPVWVADMDKYSGSQITIENMNGGSTRNLYREEPKSKTEFQIGDHIQCKHIFGNKPRSHFVINQINETQYVCKNSDGKYCIRFDAAERYVPEVEQPKLIVGDLVKVKDSFGASSIRGERGAIQKIHSCGTTALVTIPLLQEVILVNLEDLIKIGSMDVLDKPKLEIGSRIRVLDTVGNLNMRGLYLKVHAFDGRGRILARKPGGRTKYNLMIADCEVIAPPGWDIEETNLSTNKSKEDGKTTDALSGGSPPIKKREIKTGLTGKSRGCLRLPNRQVGGYQKGNSEQEEIPKKSIPRREI